MKQNLFSHRSPRNWLKITLAGPEKDIELAAGFLTWFTGNGVEYKDSPFGDNRSEGSTVIGYLEIDQDIKEKKEKLESFLTSLTAADTISLEYSNIAEEDWGENWKKNLKPFKATEHLVVKPSWDNYIPESSQETILEIDPGMAFGTGHHASTCLALELTDSYFNMIKGPQSVLDVGTGTGILGIACCLLGQNRVLAVDNDPDATVIARKNVQANGVAAQMTVKDTPLSHLNGPYNLIIANIIHDVLIDLAPNLIPLLGQGGEIILSGILKGEQAANILHKYESCGLRSIETLIKDEWQAFRLKKG
ncbi:MAG: 50S ribosomal protein L11 methyltransferase [Desulfurivibrionaceae bacterium]